MDIDTEAIGESPAEVLEQPVTDVAAEPPILDAEIASTEESYAASPSADIEAPVGAVEGPARRARKRTPKGRGAVGGSRKAAGKAAKEPKPAKPARGRARKSSRGKAAEAADTGT